VVSSKKGDQRKTLFSRPLKREERSGRDPRSDEVKKETNPQTLPKEGNVCQASLRIFATTRMRAFCGVERG